MKALGYEVDDAAAAPSNGGGDGGGSGSGAEKENRIAKRNGAGSAATDSAKNVENSMLSMEVKLKQPHSGKEVLILLPLNLFLIAALIA